MQDGKRLILVEMEDGRLACRGWTIRDGRGRRFFILTGWNF
jgi:hypothetical protein